MPIFALLCVLHGSGMEVTTVPKTQWELVGPDWTEHHRHLMVEVSRKVPPIYRYPGHSVRFRIEDAQLTSNEDAHALARFQPAENEIILYVRGLETRLQELVWKKFQRPLDAVIAADYLFQRAVVHELTHVWDRRGRISWSESWREVTAWSWLSLLPWNFGTRYDSAFASPWGAQSPGEDLATFAEIYFLPPRSGPTDADEHPKCRFPGRYYFLLRVFEDPRWMR